MYTKSGLRIVDGVATDMNNNPVGLPAGVITNKNFYDMREQRMMTIVEVNVGLLRSTGAAPANGVLYIAKTGTPGAAVRLVNGSQLPAQGLTVVSENPVYVRGDYNTVAKVPAAVLADAITVLSNNWAPNNSDKGAWGPTLGSPRRPRHAAFALGPPPNRHQQRQRATQNDSASSRMERPELNNSGSMRSARQQAGRNWRCSARGPITTRRPRIGARKRQTVRRTAHPRAADPRGPRPRR